MLAMLILIMAGCIICTGGSGSFLEETLALIDLVFVDTWKICSGEL